MGALSLPAGVATGIGSLPHTDAGAAAAMVLRCTPGLPAVPQLPMRSAREQMLAQWSVGVPGIHVGDDGAISLNGAAPESQQVDTTFDPDAHGGFLAFLDAAARLPKPPARVKAQITGPLTLGVAFADAGLEQADAFARAAGASRAWARAVEAAIARALPEAQLVLFFDEPALVHWRTEGEGPLEREEATDLLSGALASVRCLTGVHVCGQGSLRVALGAGPNVLGLDVAAVSPSDAIALGRYLDGGGWVAWGAVPTDRPIGESVKPLWKALTDLWCELARGGCDAVRLRTQAIITPACGLAFHGPSQAEGALRLARELGNRVHDQAVATKLTVGA